MAFAFPFAALAVDKDVILVDGHYSGKTPARFGA
jgi:hypothetical protein